MSALPKQEVQMRGQVDLSGSGRMWTHLGEWVFQTLIPVQVLGQKVSLQVLIEPEGAGYTLSFGTLFSSRRTRSRPFVDPGQAAAWFESELEVWLSVHQAESQLACEEQKRAARAMAKDAVDEWEHWYE